MAHEARVQQLDWARVEGDLEERGFSVPGRVLDPAECDALIALYADDRRFRKRIDMEGHTFGRGDYAYFARPLPKPVQTLRAALYRHVAPIANRWAGALGRDERYPASLRSFLAHCAEHGQTRPTPLLLHYEKGGYNRLHQDSYGDVFFPLQVAIALSRRERDYTGGELLLVEQRPRAQSRAEVVPLDQGELVIFPSGERPVPGKRGPVRLTTRHGVATVTSGRRYTLGLIFHDAR